jgi:signal transduction histidine kinase
MPDFSGLAALAVLQQMRLDLPFIMVSGTLAEEDAVEAMRSGAHDFMTKQQLSRLGPAIERELRQAAFRRQQRAVEHTLAEARDRAQFALEAAGVGTWETDRSSGAMRFSGMLEQLHGVAPGGFAGTFQAFLELIESEDRPEVEGAINRAFAHGGDCRLEYRVVWPDGSVHWIAGIGRTFNGAEGRPIKAAGIGLDVSSQKQLQDQFRQAQKMEAIGRLAGGVAHDFNNLLTAILGYSQLVLDRVADRPDVFADVEEIKRAGERASRLTAQLLAFSRKQTTVPRIVDLNHVVGNIEKMMRRVIGEDIVLQIDAAPCLGRVKLDPGLVEQVLLNLIVNARDAMPRGGVVRIATSNAILDEAFVRTHVEAEPGSYVALTVSDTGYGMQPEILARAFEPFFTTKPVGKGTGLGLSTIYGIVKQHRGYVTVDSTPGVGTTFTIYWPETGESTETARASMSEPGSARGSETVLIVEDEEPLRELVRKMLQHRGYRVLAARDAADAIAVERRHEGPIHLLLSDIVMPGLNGPDLAQRLVPHRADMAVLYMSGFAHFAGSEIGSLSGRASFIQKPFTSDALASAVRESIDRASREETSSSCKS